MRKETLEREKLGGMLGVEFEVFEEEPISAHETPIVEDPLDFESEPLGPKKTLRCKR